MLPVLHCELARCWFQLWGAVTTGTAPLGSLALHHWGHWHLLVSLQQEKVAPVSSAGSQYIGTWDWD